MNRETILGAWAGRVEGGDERQRGCREQAEPHHNLAPLRKALLRVSLDERGAEVGISISAVDGTVSRRNLTPHVRAVLLRFRAAGLRPRRL